MGVGDSNSIGSDDDDDVVVVGLNSLAREIGGSNWRGGVVVGEEDRWKVLDEANSIGRGVYLSERLYSL